MPDYRSDHSTNAAARSDAVPRLTVVISLNIVYPAAHLWPLQCWRPLEIVQGSAAEAQMITPIVNVIAAIRRMFRATRTSWRAPFSCHCAHRSSEVRGGTVSAGDGLTTTASLYSFMIQSPTMGTCLADAGSIHRHNESQSAQRTQHGVRRRSPPSQPPSVRTRRSIWSRWLFHRVHGIGRCLRVSGFTHDVISARSRPLEGGSRRKVSRYSSVAVSSEVYQRLPPRPLASLAPLATAYWTFQSFPRYMSDNRSLGFGVTIQSKCPA